eukprot:SAG11_NODE_28319_length_323_cov_0.678571_1_plen_52_part_10
MLCEFNCGEHATSHLARACRHLRIVGPTSWVFHDVRIASYERVLFVAVLLCW